MADFGGSWAGAVAAWVNVGAQAAAIAAQGQGTAMKIKEGIRDYTQAVSDLTAKGTEAQQEAQRRIGTARAEGVLGLKEQGAQAAFEGRMAMTQAEMVASSEEAKLGASGVRSTGSPLTAASSWHGDG